jgi:predicted DNA-binding protein with PD1-like motif
MVQLSRLAAASSSGERMLALRLEEGEEVVASLLEVAAQERITAAEITGIGALSSVTLGFFELDRRRYHENPLQEQVEVLSLIGNLAEFEGKPKLHAHIVVGKRDGTAMGGHLVEGLVRPTLELIVNEAPRHLRRKTDPATGLALLELERRM